MIDINTVNFCNSLDDEIHHTTIPKILLVNFLSSSQNIDKNDFLQMKIEIDRSL